MGRVSGGWNCEASGGLSGMAGVRPEKDALGSRMVWEGA